MRQGPHTHHKAGVRLRSTGAMERTLALVKPDAVAAGKLDDIVQLAELAGCTVLAQQRVQVRALRMLAHAPRPPSP